MPRIPKHRAPTPPGAILLHEFIEPMNLTQAEVARAIDVPYQRLNEVVRGTRALTPSTALRLSRYFGTSPDVWVNLQLAVDLYEAQQEEADTLNAIEPVTAA
jgi:addiction module HigA family antidote